MDMTKFWKKLGQLYVPKSIYQHPKLISHAANPLPVHIKDDVYRVFFSGRDQQNRSSVGAVDLDIVERKVVNEYNYPFFEHGPIGSFYADGVSLGNCYEVKGVRYIVFMGWQNPTSAHWRGDIGRLVLTPDLLLKIETSEPFMGTSIIDPISLSYPWVMPSQTGGFDMWYGSTHSWDTGDGEMLHVIHHAFSKDGEVWERNGQAVPSHGGYAQAFSRPTVLRNRCGDLEMWFSFRGGKNKKYRIGYARCEDEQNWNLELSSAGINVSATGWDSEMIEYPYVFDHKENCYMLYNGNGYGKTGFGLAVMNSY